jgi:hypothetical protein
MAEFFGTLLATYVLFRINLFAGKRLEPTGQAAWLIFTSALAAGLTGVFLSYFFNDGSLHQAPAILISAALISVYHFWKKPAA